jgi:hypothetical protein
MKKLFLVVSLLALPMAVFAQAKPSGVLLVTGHGNDPFVAGKSYRYDTSKTNPFTVTAFLNGIQGTTFPNHIDIIADQDLSTAKPGQRIFFQAADLGYLGPGTYQNVTSYPQPDAGTPGEAWSGVCLGTTIGNFNVTSARYEARTNGSFNVLAFNISFRMICSDTPDVWVDGSFQWTGVHEAGTTLFNPGTLISGTGSGSGGSGGTGGNGGTTPTAPTVVLPDAILAAPVTIFNSTSTDVPFSIFIPATTTTDVTLSSTTDGDDLLASITPFVIKQGNSGNAVLTIHTTPTTRAGVHAITITADDGTTNSSATVFIEVLCDPPFILGIDQPRSSTVSPGRPALLSVKASGSGPFTYQWFTGASGLVNFPLAGGTTANFTTSALNDTTSYWVRVTNPCGSADSQTTTISVSSGAKPTSRR